MNDIVISCCVGLGLGLVFINLPAKTFGLESKTAVPEDYEEKKRKEEDERTRELDLEGGVVDWFKIADKFILFILFIAMLYFLDKQNNGQVSRSVAHLFSRELTLLNLKDYFLGNTQSSDASPIQNADLPTPALPQNEFVGNEL
jgi:hypothetical protein